MTLPQIFEFLGKNSSGRQRVFKTGQLLSLNEYLKLKAKIINFFVDYYSEEMRAKSGTYPEGFC